MVNSELSAQKNLKEEAESFINMKQVKYGNKPPDGLRGKKHWWMLGIHFAVSLWAFLQSN